MYKAPAETTFSHFITNMYMYTIRSNIYDNNGSRSKPVVLDPANPFRNVIPDQRCCESMRRCARTVVHRSQQLKEYKREGPAPILEGMERGQSLQQFIQYTVQPSSDDRRKCDHLVDRITYFLQHHTRLSVNMVVRVSSMLLTLMMHGTY